MPSLDGWRPGSLRAGLLVAGKVRDAYWTWAMAEASLTAARAHAGAAGALALAGPDMLRGRGDFTEAFGVRVVVMLTLLGQRPTQGNFMPGDQT